MDQFLNKYSQEEHIIVDLRKENATLIQRFNVADKKARIKEGEVRKLEMELKVQNI